MKLGSQEWEGKTCCWNGIQGISTAVTNGRPAMAAKQDDRILNLHLKKHTRTKQYHSILPYCVHKSANWKGKAHV
eukprot:4409056-Amphidinium_carterae.2